MSDDLLGAETPKPYGGFGIRIAEYWRKERPGLAKDLDSTGSFDTTVAMAEKSFLSALRVLEAQFREAGLHPAVAESEAVQTLLPEFLNLGALPEEDEEEDLENLEDGDPT